MWAGGWAVERRETKSAVVKCGGGQMWWSKLSNGQIWAKSGRGGTAGLLLEECCSIYI